MGEFRLGSGRLCSPLTIVDAHSGFLLDCRGLEHGECRGSGAGFERVFREGAMLPGHGERRISQQLQDSPLLLVSDTN